VCMKSACAAAGAASIAAVANGRIFRSRMAASVSEPHDHLNLCNRPPRMQDEVHPTPPAAGLRPDAPQWDGCPKALGAGGGDE
jgi:hypothetical protein